MDGQSNNPKETALSGGSIHSVYPNRTNLTNGTTAKTRTTAPTAIAATSLKFGYMGESSGVGGIQKGRIIIRPDLHGDITQKSRFFILEMPFLFVVGWMKKNTSRFVKARWIRTHDEKSHALCPWLFSLRSRLESVLQLFSAIPVSCAMRRMALSLRRGSVCAVFVFAWKSARFCR